MVAEGREFWLAWSRISGIGPVLLKRIYLHFGQLEVAWQASAEALVEVEGIGSKLAQTIVQQRPTLHPDRLLAEHLQRNPDFLIPPDPDYPPLLREIPDPPPILYYRGQLDSLRRLATTSAIAIVGTRAPSEYGRRWTRKLSARLAKHGFVIVSGLAAGIDAEAHRSCLMVGGVTIAVLGTGVDGVYPESNRPLFEQVLETGVLLSEYPAGTPPERSHFPQRNRIVAGLSRATLVMEASDKRSGVLITARLANEYGQEVYVLPGNLDQAQSKECLVLLGQGAQVILGEEELLELLDALPDLRYSPLPMTLSTPQPALSKPPDLSADLLQIWQAIAMTAQTPPNPGLSFDAIVQQTEQSAALVSSLLIELELLGLVTQLPGMRYQII